MEDALIRNVKQHGDHHAYAHLVKMHQSAVRNFLRRLVHNDAIADELAQETFIRAYTHINSFRGDGKFLSWLFRIAYQEFAKLYRKNSTVEFATNEIIEAVTEMEPQIVAAKTAEHLLQSLRPEERAMILLHFSHDLSHQEIAKILETPLGTVKSLIRRGQQRLFHYYQTKNQGVVNE
ncbi:RNA polymerase sigma factor [Thalassotalea fusca]